MNAVAVPDRSLQQRYDALRRANEVRAYRKALKVDLKAGRVQLTDVLQDPPELLESMKMLDLLLATPKLGRVKASKALHSCRISPSKTVGGLSERQRRELVYLLLRRF